MPSRPFNFAAAPRRRFQAIAVLLAGLLAAGFMGPVRAQQLVGDAVVQDNFTGVSQIGTNVGIVGQMAFGPDGRLYVGTYASGVKRYDYNPGGSLTNGVTVWTRPADPPNGQLNGTLGIAFHQDPTLGTVMYIAPAVNTDFSPGLDSHVQSIVRLTDSNGNGAWGEAGELHQAIVDNLRVTDLHQVNNLLVDGDKLYVGIGSRTRTGGDVSEYGGAPNPDDGEFSYTGAINWIRDLTLLGNTTTANVAGFNGLQHHTATTPFTSTNPGKLTVYSTGFRNVYGIAMDGDGQLWATMNQNENPLKPDEIHRSDFQDDHKFPKQNEVGGDWKLNAAAQAAGFFQNFVDPVTTLGNHASANGVDFTEANDVFAGHPFLVRYSAGDDLLAVDPDDGSIQTIAAGFSDPLAVTTDPQGNLLVGTFGGRIYRVGVVPGAGVPLGDLDRDGSVDAQDWTTLRDNFFVDMTGLTALQARMLGDLNGDLANDELDFGLFKNAYEDFNGPGSFAAMLSVPEPSALALLAIAGGACSALLRKPRVLNQPARASIRLSLNG